VAAPDRDVEQAPLSQDGPSWRNVLTARDRPQRRKIAPFLFLPSPDFRTIAPQLVTMLESTLQHDRGVMMRAFRRWSSEEREPGHPIALFRQAPRDVLAERDSAWASEWTPNMVVLGDPLPGRSALDAKLRLRPH
jgi:hypothetical protein